MDDQIVKFLKSEGYLRPKKLVDGDYGAILKLMFHSAIIKVSTLQFMVGYSDRWCFTNENVDDAFDSWDGSDDPKGWHRHPDTGRRRPDGNPEKEYIEW